MRIVLRQGSIVRARVLDPQRRNLKIRPLVVITPTDEIGGGQPLAVVAITGVFPEPPNEDEIVLPHHAGGQAATGLRKPSVAKCSWQEAIDISDVIEIKGFVSEEVLARVLAKVAELGESGLTSEPNP